MSKDRASERGTDLAVWFGMILTLPILFLLLAWPVMLALGIAHSRWSVIPAFGYWETWGLSIGIRYSTALLQRISRS